MNQAEFVRALAGNPELRGEFVHEQPVVHPHVNDGVQIGSATQAGAAAAAPSR